VLFVEQNLDLIVSLADRGFVMDKGRIVASLGPRRSARATWCGVI
jgi:urea transport system ATP-binding protein